MSRAGVRSVIVAILALSIGVTAVADRRRTVFPGGAAPATVPMPMPMPMPAVATVAGVVTTVSGTLVTLMNGRVVVDVREAQIFSRSGHASIADVRPGVRITAILRTADVAPGAPLPASAITIVDPADGHLTGTVQRVDVAGSTLTVLGQTIRVTPQTKIVGVRHTGEPITLAKISVGDVVSVEVNVGASSLDAVTLMVMPPPMAAVHGTVRSITPTLWVIADRSGRETRVVVNAETRISGTPAVGDEVVVTGRHDAQGNFVAASISKAPPAPQLPAEVTFEGAVTAKSDYEWTVAGMRVIVTPRTTISGNPQVGDRVRVTGMRVHDGTVLATAIAKL